MILIVAFYEKIRKVAITCYIRIPSFLVIFLIFFSAGLGVLNAARKTMARMLGNTETAFDSAQSQFWVVDAQVCYSILM